MIGLLDTHTLIWFDSDSAKLSPAARSFIADPANDILVSVVSVWEIVIKQQTGKLTLHRPLDEIISDQTVTNLRLLPIRLDHALAVRGLPGPHKDPFDRMLVAQAIAEGAVLLAEDAMFAHYPVTVVW